MKKEVILMFLFLAFAMQFVSASISCTPSSISTSYTVGQSILSQNISCVNSANSSVNITALGSYFSISSSSIGNLEQKTIAISFSSAPNAGNYYGQIFFSDGSTAIPITMIAQQQSSSDCYVDIFPTILSNVKISQGEKKTRNIQLTIPECYPSSVSLSGVSLMTDEKPINLGEFSGGTIQKGNSVIIPIEIDATTAPSGTYSDTLSFLLYNSTGSRINVASVSISVMVTVGTTPITNFSFAQLPTCSLNSLILSLNNSYKLTCTIVNPNIEVSPKIDSKYLKGLSVTESSSQYIYEFQPILLGTTTISADFLYRNSPIGTPFEQEIKISPSGVSPASGVNMKFNFYQGGTKKEKGELSSGEITALVLDEKTDSIIPSFILYLNGAQINNTFILSSDKTYELRATSSGYLDKVVNITITKLPLSIIFTPSQSEYITGQSINISTSPENASILFDNSVITSPLSLLTAGTFTIKAVKEGYEATEINITVKNAISYTTFSPAYEEWKVGSNVAMALTQNANWTVKYNDTIIASGNDNIVKFKIDKLGKYEISAEGTTLASKTIEKGSNWFFDNWFYVLIGVAGFFVLIFIIRRINKNKGYSGGVFTGSGETIIQGTPMM